MTRMGLRGLFGLARLAWLVGAWLFDMTAASVIMRRSRLSRGGLCSAVSGTVSALSDRGSSSGMEQATLALPL